jgi:hypothetical protein
MNLKDKYVSTKNYIPTTTINYLTLGGYRVPEFSKFSEDDGKTTLEHVD